MSWALLLDLIAEEAGIDAAARVERRALSRLRGVRITVGARRPLKADDIERVAPGRPREAARKLGISPSSAYRLLGNKPLVR